ncbi:MAG: C25 family cysteine peptidase, partial [Candidatus Zixiibacteriota bacterium]
MRVYYISLLFAVLATGAGIQAAQPICTFYEDSLSLSSLEYHFGYAGADRININETLSLPFITLYIKSNSGLSKSDFFTPAEDRVFLASLSAVQCSSHDLITGITDDYSLAPDREQADISSPVYDIQYTYLDGEKYAVVSILPVTISEDNEMIFVKSLYMDTGADIESIKDRSDIIENLSVYGPLSPANSVNRGSSMSGVPLGFDYVIITDQSLVAVFNELAGYKTSCGYSSAVVTVDSIIQNYSGLDNAAKIRNYLKDFYASGGRYVLLGGDEVLVPARYLYYYDTDFPITNTYLLRPSDLYYADLDGDWDGDNDGIWGEPSDDAPDIRPELIVGRLPLKTAEAAQNYIDKLITYETNPGDGNFDYLARALFFS